MKTTRYTNMTVAKLKNRRVLVRVDEQDNIRLGFIILSDELNPRAVHETYKDKIVTTSIVLSKEAAIGLYNCLKYELLKIHH